MAYATVGTVALYSPSPLPRRLLVVSHVPTMSQVETTRPTKSQTRQVGHRLGMPGHSPALATRTSGRRAAVVSAASAAPGSTAASAAVSLLLLQLLLVLRLRISLSPWVSAASWCAYAAVAGTVWLLRWARCVSTSWKRLGPRKIGLCRQSDIGASDTGEHYEEGLRSEDVQGPSTFRYASTSGFTRRMRAAGYHGKRLGSEDIGLCKRSGRRSTLGVHEEGLDEVQTA
eukprot:365765-Chlamydomonas_euryale.AAC.9